jgi:opacity protein-like surface antigen
MQYTLSSIKVIPYSLVWISLLIVPLQAQDLSFGQKISELDARAQILEVRLSESEDQSRRFRVFIAQAQARLKSRRASSNFIESGTTTPPVSPPISTPLDPKDIPPAPKPKRPNPESDDIFKKPKESKGYYIKTFGGFLIPETVRAKPNPTTILPIKSKNGFSTGLLFGRDFGKFRMAGEISGRKYQHESIDLSSFSLGPNNSISGYTSSLGALVSAIYDIDISEKLDLQIGVGSGVNAAKLKIKEIANVHVNTQYKDTLFAYQLFSGLTWDFTKNVSAQFIYKYFTTAGGNQFKRLGAHNLELGVQVDL